MKLWLKDRENSGNYEIDDNNFNKDKFLEGKYNIDWETDLVLCGKNSSQVSSSKLIAKP